MAASRSSLGTLLIISAVDMLLCCFTMGVMLFLVFQPSQSGDQASAKLLGIAGFEPIASGGAGDLATPAVIVIDNMGTNRLVPTSLPAGYKVPTSTSPNTAVSATSGPIVLTAVESPSLSELDLQSTKDGGATLAQISVAAHGKLTRAPLHCPQGAGNVTIDITKDNPIETRPCSNPNISTMLCPLDVNPGPGVQFDIRGADVDPSTVHVLVIPKQSKGTIQGPNCMLSPTFDPSLGKDYREPPFTTDLFTIAQDCHVDLQGGPVFADGQQTQCILDKLSGTNNEHWHGLCDGPAPEAISAGNARAFFAFTPRTSPNQSCTKAQITP